MNWDLNRSRARIHRFRATTPEASIKVRDFAREYRPERQALAKAMGMLTEASTAIVDVPFNEAILTDGVHIYADLMDFSEQLSSEGQDSEASQKRAMQFLHLHYGSCDRLIGAFGIQRVDFHGGRLHAVVLEPEGEAGERERLVRAIAFAETLRNMAQTNGERFRGRYRTRICVGIDTGKAVAINSGKRTEHEPLFIGSPANRAAHLAACGVEGIHLSDRARQVLARAAPGRVAEYGSVLAGLGLDTPAVLNEGLDYQGLGGRSLRERVFEARAAYDQELELAELSGAPVSFVFHRHTPPLRTIDFSVLTPSRAIRMEMASLFADLDGFTAYVDHGIASGGLAEVIANLHVMRGEFAAVLRDDFEGRKVRFIGDCLHGVIARGTATTTDGLATIDAAVLAAGGLRSSFDLCKSELNGIAGLGLAIGVDYGPTPAARIGLRGPDGVRCVTSTATCCSEALQQGQCGGEHTGLCAGALAAASRSVRQAFVNRPFVGLDYPTAVVLVQGLPQVRINTASAAPVRAHAR